MKRARLVGLTSLALVLGAVTLSAAPAKKAAPTAPKSSMNSKAVSDSDVALVRVGNEVITPRVVAQRLAEIPDQYRANYSTPEGRQQLLDRLVEEKIWLLDAEQHGVSQRPEVQRQLVQQRRDLLIRTWVNELMATNPAPSDSDAMVYYNSHMDDFKMPASVTVRHIMLKTEVDAKKVALLAKAKGADWNKLVTQFTADTSTKTNGGLLGTVTKDGGFAALGPQPALAESAMALGEGKIGGPFKTDKGWHVIKVDTYKAESTRPIDQVRTFITRQISQQRTQTFYQDQLAKTKAKMNVKPDSSAIKNWMSARKTARELFQEAQNAGGPQARIDAYRKVVSEFPAADISPQAQFMVGFIQSEELKDYDNAEKAFRGLLAQYPKSELAASAQWMLDHMRTEEAPGFLHLDADSSKAAPAKPGDAKSSNVKP
jgi:peptidyl-prolyl cis-trans isomerase C